MSRFLDGPVAGVTLMNARAPQFLRVVTNPPGQDPPVDCLDQLHDVAEPHETIHVYVSTGLRVPLDVAEGIAGEVLDAILPACEQAIIAGSIRRRAETVGDVEIVAIPKRRQRVVQDGFFEQHEVLDDELRDKVDELIARGLMAPHPTDPKRGERYQKLVHASSGLQVDLFSVRASTWGLGVLIRTGPAEYSHWFVNEVRRHYFHVAQGFQLHRGALGCGSVPCAVIPTPDEDEVYRILGIPFVAPKDRGT